jgi:hypothetical protein
MDLNPHAIETDRLEEENRLLEAQLNINKAQIDEYKAEVTKQQEASQTRGELLEKAAERLIKGTRIINFKDRGFNQMINNNLGDINRTLSGNGEPIAPEELKALVIKKAEALGLIVL